MPSEPGQMPDGGGRVSGGRPARSGTGGAGVDVTDEPGQYPPGADWANAIFGGPLPGGTGAPGTQGASGASDPTNEPGQVSDGLTGLPDSAIIETGAPGMSTTPNTPGGADTISYTRPGSPFSGTYKSDSLTDDVAGVHDSTGANDEGYASGGPQLPGIAGNEPQAGTGRYQPGGGRVMRGGRMNGQG